MVGVKPPIICEVTMNGYTTFQIIKALKIPRERLKDWMEKGFVKPSLQQARGKGTKALFSLLDVYSGRVLCGRRTSHKKKNNTEEDKLFHRASLILILLIICAKSIIDLSEKPAISRDTISPHGNS